MDLIDNRYKIQSILGENADNVEYKAIDFWNEDKRLLMTLYNIERQAQVIDYFVDNFIYLCKIKHEYLLESYEFDIIRTIDRKRTNDKQYYVTTEYNNRSSLDQVHQNLSFHERLNIILQISMVLDFLNYSGIAYKHLSPSNIFLMRDGNIKIKDLSTICGNTINANYDDLTRYFIAPEALLGSKDTINNNADKYSLGMLIKYLFLENFHIDNSELFIYRDMPILKSEQIKFFNTTIIDWTKKNSTIRRGSLVTIRDNICDIFDIKCDDNIKGKRRLLNFNNKIVGREKELEKILNISGQPINERTHDAYVLVKGSAGVGKTRLLREVSYQLKIRGKDAYFFGVMEEDNANIKSMTSILRQTIQDAPEDLLNKYRNELVNILPELKSTFQKEILNAKNEYIERLRLYDRISKYLEELSRERPIYFIIDDITKISPQLLYLLEYIKDNIKSGHISAIISYDEKDIEKGSYKEEFLNKLKLDENINQLQLHNLNLQGIEKFVQHVLGISYEALKFSAFMLKESQGNPGQMEYIMKELFDKGELFCNNNGYWEMKTKKYSDIYLPINKDESMKNQMILLKSGYMDIMRAISVSDSSISKEALLKILNIERADLNLKLEELIAMNFLDKRVADWGYSYSISHRQLEKLIYREISKSKRIELHKTMACLLEEKYKKNHNILLEELIYHLRRAEQMDKVLYYIVMDAKENLKTYSSQSLFRWEEAYEISKTINSEYKPEIFENLGKAYANEGENHKALKIFVELYHESIILSEFKYAIVAKIQIAKIYLRKNLIDLSLREIEKAIKLSDDVKWLDGFVQAQILFNQILYHQGKMEEIEGNMKELLDISISNKLENNLGSIYNILGVVNYYNENVEQAIEYYNKSILSFQNLSETIKSIQPINNIGKIHLEYYGNNKKAMEYYMKALKIAEDHRVFDMEMKLLNNIGENYMAICQYDKAIKYIEKAKIMSIDMEDENMIFSTNMNLGLVHILIGESDKAYNSYTIIKESSRKKVIYAIEKMGQYYRYLGEFYFHFGQWDKSIIKFQKAKDIYERYNQGEYLIAKSNISLIENIKNSTYDRSSIEDIRIEIRDINIGFCRRRILLNIAITLYSKKEYEHALDILTEDKELIEDYPFEIFDYINRMLFNAMDTRDDCDITLLEKDIMEQKYPHINMLSNEILGFKFAEDGDLYKSIKYLLEAFELLYTLIRNIPDRELQISYIKSRRGDYIKGNIIESVYKVSGDDLEYNCIEDLNSKDVIEKYFDYSFVSTLLDNKDFAKTIEPYYDYEEIKNIHDLGTLVSNLTNNYKYNIKLILKYISKETLAKTGYVLFYDDESNRYLPIVSLNNELEELPNENLLALANRNEKGVLISNNLGADVKGLYKGFLPEDTRALISIPIRASELSRFSGYEKRNKGQKISDEKNNGYIYLDADNRLNRFDNKRHDLVYIASKLININMENYKLKTLSTIDKLTGTYTRKHFDAKFRKIIHDAKRSKESFALIMIDVDNFKNINDTYGHRKGDEVLTEIGHNLMNSVRSTDLVARYGGEEFIIILRNVKEEEAIRIGEKIRNNIEIIKRPRIQETITISLGISIYPRHSRFKEDLIEKADQALYEAKEKGRNTTMVWNAKLSDGISRVDRLAGIISGNVNNDEKNMLLILDIIELTKENIEKEEKIFKFLNKIIEELRADNCDLIIIDGYGKIEDTYGRSRLNENWTHNKAINYNIVERVISKGRGEFLIDWDNIKNRVNITKAPDWQSTIAIPLKFKSQTKGVLYITVAIKEKEFDYNAYNLSKVLCDVFSPAIWN